VPILSKRNGEKREAQRKKRYSRESIRAANESDQREDYSFDEKRARYEQKEKVEQPRSTQKREDAKAVREMTRYFPPKRPFLKKLREESGGGENDKREPHHSSGLRRK